MDWGEGEGEVGVTNRENSLQVGKGSELGLVVGFKIYRVLWEWRIWGVGRLSDEGGEGVLESEVMEEEVMYWNV